MPIDASALSSAVKVPVLVNLPALVGSSAFSRSASKSFTAAWNLTFTVTG